MNQSCQACQCCHMRPAERQILLVSGRKQWRCVICIAERKKASSNIKRASSNIKRARTRKIK